MNVLVLYPKGEIRPYGSRLVTLSNGDNWLFHTPDSLAGIKGYTIDKVILSGLNLDDLSIDHHKQLMPQLSVNVMTHIWHDEEVNRVSYSHWGMFDE
jgi:hypothetical protein